MQATIIRFWAQSNKARLLHPLPSQVRVLVNPDFEEVKAGIAEFKPTFLYLCGHTSYDQNKAYGTISGLQFRGATRIKGLPHGGVHLHGPEPWVLP